MNNSLVFNDLIEFHSNRHAKVKILNFFEINFTLQKVNTLISKLMQLT